MSGLSESRGRARVPEALIRTSLRHPWAVLGAWLVLALLASPGVLSLQIDTSTDSVLDRNHPDWAVYQQSQDLFGGDEVLVIALLGNHPLDPEALSRVRDLSERLEGLRGVRRVDSLSTVPAIGLDHEGGLDLRPSLDGGPEQPGKLGEHVSLRLEGDRIAYNSFISEDKRVLAINVLLDRGQEGRHGEILNQIRAITDPHNAIVSGVPVFRAVVNEKTGGEILRFVPITAILIALLLALIFRSVLAIALSFVPGVLGSWFLLAAMGYTGAPLSITTMVLPSILLALGCAYAMHPLVAASGSQPQSENTYESKLCAALSSVALPVALSGLTTCVGFLAMTLVRIDAVRSTGLYGAVGVLAVTALTLTALPAALQLSGRVWPEPALFSPARDRFAKALVSLAVRRRTAVLTAWILVGGLSVAGIWKVQVETDATRWLPPGHEVRDSYEEIRQTLSGISPMNVVIRAPEGENLLAPETLEIIDQLSTELELRNDVGRTLAITDPLRQMGGSLLTDPSQPLPDSVFSAEQYLVLLESVDQVHDLVTPDRQTANILIRADNNGSAALRQIAEYVQSWWENHAPQGYSAQTTGIMYEFARAQDEIVYGQVRGLGVALLVVSLILFVIFRWPLLAAAAMVPNAIPLLMIFGGLGLLGWPLDAGTVLIGCLALGIAVDDTIHITTNFHERIRAGESSRRALTEALSTVLPAIACTTLIIGLGFAVIGFSEFAVTRNLGLLTAAVVALCLIADLTLLPALLARLQAGPRQRSGRPSPPR